MHSVVTNRKHQVVSGGHIPKLNGLMRLETNQNLLCKKYMQQYLKYLSKVSPKWAGTISPV